MTSDLCRPSVQAAGVGADGKGVEPSPPSTAVPARTSSRIPALDGVRGIAALIVVLQHSMLATSAALVASIGPDRDVHGTVTWLLTRTPLQIVWAGHEAVLVFFVLSGLVLALPHLGDRDRAPSWPAYYGSRAVRLYLPVWGALVVAFVLSRATGWTHSGAGTSWLLDHGRLHTADSILGDASLALPRQHPLIGALWSLRWEIAFSVLLPVYILVARTVRRAELIAVASVAMIGLSLGDGAGTYLPVFLLGVVVAREREAITARIAPLGPAPLGGLLALIVVLITARAWGQGLSFGLTTAMATVGATLAVILAMAHPAAQRLLTRRAVRWLGTRSFALYLVHEPIVTSLAYLLGRTPSMPLFLLVAVPAALAGAELFFRGIERPAHRLARHTGRAITARRGQTKAPSPTLATPAEPARRAA